MPKYTKTEFSVGIIVLAALIFLIVGVRMIGGPFRKTDTVYVYFRMVKGLNQGDLVKLSGVRIGWIENMAHSPAAENPYNENMVKLTCKIDSDRFKVLGKTSKAYIESAGIVGEYYIELSFLEAGSASLEPGDHILGRDPYGIEDITAGLAEGLASVQKIIGNEEARQNFFVTIGNLSSITTKLSSAMGDVQSVTESLRMLPNITRDVHESVKSFRSAADNVNRLVQSATPQISHSVEDLNVTTARVRKEFLDQTSQILTNLSQVSEDLRATAGDLRETVGANKGKLDQTLSNVQIASATFADTLAQAHRIMARLDRLSDRVEKGEGTIGKLLVDKTWEQKAEETLDKTNDTLGTYRDFGKRIGSLSRPHLEYEFRYSEEDKDLSEDDNNFRNDLGLRFDFGDKNWAYLGADDVGEDSELELTGGRWFWDWFTLYGGVIESEAGLGVGFRFRDRLSLWVEGIGLTDEDEERLDIIGNWRFYDHASLLLGVEDVGDESFITGGIKLDL